MLKLLNRLFGIKIKPKHIFKIGLKFEMEENKKIANFACKKLYGKLTSRKNLLLAKNLPSENSAF